MSNKIKKYKKDLDYSYSLGIYLTIELLTYKIDQVKCVYISSNTNKSSGVEKIIQICHSNNIQLEVNDNIINKLSPKQNCYTIGIFNKFENQIDSNENHVVLVNPSDSGNLGTIVRTSLGFNLRNLAIIKPSVDIFDPKTIRASMGAIFSISFEYFNSLEEYIQKFKIHNIYTFMLNAKKTLHNVDVNYEQPFSLVFGNEASGLDKKYETIGTSVIIPHQNKIDSLNLSIAVGIVEYEFTKIYFKR